MEAHECDACLAPGTKAALGAAWRDWTGQEGVSTVADRDRMLSTDIRRPGSSHYVPTSALGDVNTPGHWALKPGVSPSK